MSQRPACQSRADGSGRRSPRFRLTAQRCPLLLASRENEHMNVKALPGSLVQRGLRKTASCRNAWCAASLLALIGIAGCGADQTLPGSVPVSGVITYQGQPLPEGIVRFAPSDGGGQPATGTIKGGVFSMQTTRSSPGVVKGTYKVSILSEKTVALSLPADTPPDPNRWPEAESLIPKRYGDVRTSDLEVKVDAPRDDLRFDLTDK